MIRRASSTASFAMGVALASVAACSDDAPAPADTDTETDGTAGTAGSVRVFDGKTGADKTPSALSDDPFYAQVADFTGDKKPDLLLVESDAEGRYLTIKNAFAPAHPGVIIQTFAPASVNSAKIASIMATYNLASLDLSVQGLALKPVVIKPFTFPNQNLRMDATGVDASNLSGGVVNGKFYEVGPTEQFYLIGQPDGTFVVASVASPGVYLRMDASTVKEFTNSGGGVVNCQYGIGPLTKFYIVPQGGGVSFASQAFPGVFLRFDGTNLVGAPGGKTGSIVNCQFGAKTLETFTINPAG